MKFQHILVPVDFSEHSIAALKTAGVLAQQLNGIVVCSSSARGHAGRLGSIRHAPCDHSRGT